MRFDARYAHCQLAEGLARAAGLMPPEPGEGAEVGEEGEGGEEGDDAAAQDDADLAAAAPVGCG